MTTNVFIDGAAGTTGLQIEERLAGRTDLTLIKLPEERRKEAGARAEALNDADIVVLCLPDEAAREAVGLIDNPRTRVIDASTAHRVAEGWHYGFPEVTGQDEIASAARVSNPGCYPTGFVALVAPLVAAGLIVMDWPLTCNAVSGYSGGGKAMIAEYEAAGGRPSAWRTYGLDLAHKHVPEMRARAGLEHAPIFAPAVAPVYSGMIVDVPLPLAAMPGSPAAQAVRDVLARAYEGSPIVSLAAHGETTLPVERLAGTDRLELFVFADESGRHARLVAALDNLGKGAAGAAVQNLNLMSGAPETEGLRL